MSEIPDLPDAADDDGQRPAWMVVHVTPTVDDPPHADAYAYTEGMHAAFRTPNLWLSYRGACGHRMNTRVAHWCANHLADRVILGELAPGDWCDVPTGEDEVLRFTVGEPVEREAADAIEAWPDDGWPILPLSWRCSLDADWAPSPPDEPAGR
ncbi:MAG: hypothetical protein HYX34_08075 [Actinobacteria bacterium]|nr:hypothetical protein [Actinomycetota bacterium]